jgi:hypothetical protein
MNKRKLWTGAAALLLAAGVGAYALGTARASRHAERADCPGKITCPLTGEEICKDKCPVGVEAQASAAKKSGYCPSKKACAPPADPAQP